MLRRTRFSKAATSGPWASMPLRITRSTAARSSSPMSGLAGGMNSFRLISPPQGISDAVALAVQRRRWRGRPTVGVGLGLRRLPALPDPADPPGRDAGHEGRAGTSRVTTAPAATSAQAPIVTGATQTARAPIEAPSSTVTPTASQSLARLELAVGGDRARVGVVGQHDGRADEDAVAEPGRLVDQRVVLDLAVVADVHAGADVGAPADDAVRRARRLRGPAPGARRSAGADGRFRRDVGRRLDPDAQENPSDGGWPGSCAWCPRWPCARNPNPRGG